MLTPADADLVRREPAIPGLGIVLDPEAFISRLSQCLPGSRIGNARSTYIRFKPGKDCLVNYELEIDEKMVNVYALAHRINNKDRYKKVCEDVDSSVIPGRLYLDDCVIIVSFFPKDSKIEVLPRLMDTLTRRYLLSKLLPSYPFLWYAAFRTLRYKPQRRYVAGLFNKDGPEAILKVYAESGYSAAHNNAKEFRSTGKLRIARLLGSLDHHHMLAFEWLPGRPINNVPCDTGPTCAELSAAAAALFELHAQKTRHLKSLTRETESRTLLDVARVVSITCPDIAMRTSAIAQKIAKMLLSAPTIMKPIHGDFYADQVLIDGDTVSIIDLDEAVLGDPAADLGNFVAHLERHAIRDNISLIRVEPLKNALLQGYEDTAHRPQPSRVSLYNAAGLLRLMPKPFRYREPNWPEKTELILQHIETIMKKVE